VVVVRDVVQHENTRGPHRCGGVQVSQKAGTIRWRPEAESLHELLDGVETRRRPNSRAAFLIVAARQWNSA